MKNQKPNFRSQVFSTAWLLVGRTKKQFAVCLAKAWQLFRLKRKLQFNEEVKFSFEKVDGSLRVAYGTLKDVIQFVKGNGIKSQGVLHYFDIEKVAFRCFRIENLVNVY